MSSALDQKPNIGFSQVALSQIDTVFFSMKQRNKTAPFAEMTIGKIVVERL